MVPNSSLLFDAPGQFLLMSDSDPFIDEFNRERLHFAAQDGDLDEVRRLLDDGFQPSEFDGLGKTPLHYAAERGHVEVMKALLAAGADVNANDERVIGNTPLREVAANCSYEVATILIAAGADPTIPGWMQITALQQARERHRPEGSQIRQLLEDAAARLGKAT